VRGHGIAAVRRGSAGSDACVIRGRTKSACVFSTPVRSGQDGLPTNRVEASRRLKGGQMAYQGEGRPEIGGNMAEGTSRSSIGIVGCHRAAVTMGFGRFRGDSSSCPFGTQRHSSAQSRRARAFLVEPIRASRASSSLRAAISECERNLPQAHVLLMPTKSRPGWGHRSAARLRPRGREPDGLISAKPWAADCCGIGVFGRAR